MYSRNKRKATPLPFNQWFGDSLTGITWISVDLLSTILWFSESLERDLSNDVIKNHIWEIKTFANYFVRTMDNK